MASQLVEKRLSPARWIVSSIGIILAVAAIGYLPLTRWLGTAIDQMRQWGVVGSILFLLAYIILATLAFPIIPLNAAAGILFGAVWGFAAGMAAAVATALASFLIARHGLKDWLTRKWKDSHFFHAIQRAALAGGWKGVLLVRLMPLAPNAVKNYGFGLTDVPITTYLIASAIGVMPNVLIYTYLGAIGRVTLGGGAKSLDATDYVLYGAGAVVTAVCAVFIVRYVMKALKAEMAETQPAR